MPLDKIKSLISLYPENYFCDPKISVDMIESLRRFDDIDDVDFDRIFPALYQYHSAVHWSPVAVAMKITEWVKDLKQKKFLDIGCGVGKLCILISILTEHEVYGIEQRAPLVQIAQDIIATNNLSRISIQQKNMLNLDWSAYDIYYLYNPFQEHVAHSESFIIDQDLDFDKKFYIKYTSEVFRQLSWAAPGKVFITYHGYGGEIPSDWHLFATERINNGDLKMWVKEYK